MSTDTTSDADPDPSGTGPAGPAPTVWPSVMATDARHLVDFLVAAFGFEEVVAYEEGGVIAHAELAWPPGGGIMLGTYRSDGTQGGSAPGTSSAYAVTDDPDGLYARATRAGATVVRPLTDTDYGSREFGVEDPEGNRWSFGTYRGHPRG